MRIGRLGYFEVTEGYYAYVGSARGSGGIRARLRYHLQKVSRPRWHIDYLRTVAEHEEVWFSTSSLRLEKDWAELMARWSWFRKVIPGFGCSEYHHAHITHLFYSKRKPSFNAFEKIVWHETQGNVEVQRIEFV